ncbi:MAG: PadR family transcriptional regulator [Candidatus Woesearchaeota archaeon]
MELPNHLSVKGFLMLQILHKLNKQRLCGDELAAIIGGKRGSKLTPGTIYPALKFLRKKKLIRQKRAGRKKLYELTPEGKEEYALFRRLFLKMFGDILRSPRKPTKKKKVSKIKDSKK